MSNNEEEYILSNMLIINEFLLLLMYLLAHRYFPKIEQHFLFCEIQHYTMVLIQPILLVSKW
jgi:hypothetical protein